MIIVNRAVTYRIDDAIGVRGRTSMCNATRQKHDLEEECKEEAAARAWVSCLEGLPCERRPLSFLALCSSGVPSLEASLGSSCISVASFCMLCPSPAQEWLRFQIRVEVQGLFD